jgi:uroporphyrinogen decarboxylase
LYFLRGFENLMMDIATDDPHLPELIERLTQYELELVGLWLDAGVDVVGFHTDIGTQRALMISPAKFRRYIKPMFKTIFRKVRDAGALVALSSDGCLLEIVDDLVECGVNKHDPQFRANTLEGIERAYKGKMCIHLDLDRQMFAFCKPQDIRDQVREAVERLNSPEGGLMLLGQVYDDNTPLENIEALIAAMEESCGKHPG